MERGFIMGKVRVAAFSFLLSGVFLAICCFLPLKTLVITGGMEETSVLRLMPSVGGFFVLVLALCCILFPILGYKSYSALVGAGSAILGGGLLWYYTNSAEASAAQVSQVEEVIDGMFSSFSNTPAVETTVTVTTNVGFSLTIIALVLVLITGFAYTLVDEN